MHQSHQSFVGYLRKFISNFPDSCAEMTKLTLTEQGNSWIQVDIDHRPGIRLVFWMPDPDNRNLVRDRCELILTTPERAQEIRGSSHDIRGWDKTPEFFWQGIQGTPIGIPPETIEIFPEIAYMRNFIRQGCRIYELLPHLWQTDSGPQSEHFHPAWWSLRKQVFLADPKAARIPLKSMRYLFQGIRNAETLLADPHLCPGTPTARQPNFHRPGPNYSKESQPQLAVNLMCPDSDLVARGFARNRKRIRITQGQEGIKDLANELEQVPRFIPSNRDHHGRAEIQFYTKEFPDFPQSNIELAGLAAHSKIAWLLRPRTELASFLKFNMYAALAYAAFDKWWDSSEQRLVALRALRPEIRISTRSPMDVLEPKP